MENIFSNKVVVGLLGLGVLFILGSIGSSTGVNEAAVLAGIGCFLVSVPGFYKQKSIK